MTDKPFLTHNDKPIDVNGTGLLAYLHELSYARIVDMFGEPMADGYDDFKIDAQWRIQFPDGEVATVYNYKTGRNYIGPDAPDVKDITKWNIGGKNKDVVFRIHQLLMKDVTHYA